MKRPVQTIFAAATLTVALATPAAAHAPTSGFVEGTIASVNTRSNRITLTDGTVVKYRHGDTFATTQIHEQPDADPFDCNVTDHGSLDHGTDEDTFEQLLVPGARLQADAKRQRRHGVSFFYVVLNTCDGVLDARDTVA